MPSRTALRQERPFRSFNGYVMILLALLALAFGVYQLLSHPYGPGVLLGALSLAVGVILLPGLYMLQPNEAAILMLFGQYRGSDRAEGLRWANPLYAKRKLSLRARNLNAPTLKVNDRRGNPVEISAAVVWCVRDTAQAVFEVDDFEMYVRIQAEAALRHLASMYAYDEGEDLATAKPRCAPAWTTWWSR